MGSSKIPHCYSMIQDSVLAHDLDHLCEGRVTSKRLAALISVKSRHGRVVAGAWAASSCNCGSRAILAPTIFHGNCLHASTGDRALNVSHSAPPGEVIDRLGQACHDRAQRFCTCRLLDCLHYGEPSGPSADSCAYMLHILRSWVVDLQLSKSAYKQI